MQFINLTPHDIDIGRMGENNKFELLQTILKPTDGKIARVKTESIPCDPIDGIAVHAERFGEVENLLEPVEGVRYIVSMAVAQARPDRSDLLCSYSEKAFPEGARILGVPGLVSYEPVEKKKTTSESIPASFTKFVNMSFQDTIIGELGDDKKVTVLRTIPKSEKVAKLDTAVTPLEPIDGIPHFRLRFLQVIDLPPEEEGVIYIVPMPVAQMCDRNDLLSADTGNAFREDGKIVGVPGLVRYIS